jgi:thiosulfate/3-mercaptopyruvate sulfurtransferase
MQPPIPALVLAASVAAALAVSPTAIGAQATRPDLLVTTDWLAARVRDPAVVVLHAAMQRADYEAGHVPGSRWMPWSSFTRQLDGLSTELPDAATLDSALEAAGVSDGSHIVISGGPITVTARLFFTLDYFGLGDRVSVLDGGIDAWREEGRPTERTATAVARGRVTLQPQFDRFADARWIAANTASPARMALVDARAPEFHSGLAGGANMPRSGRLPGAVNVPFTWMTGDVGRLRDRARLEQLFARAGVRRGDKVVTYCHVGMQASVVYLAAKLLGYDAAVYDGSFEDWSRRAELPVTTDAARPPER